MNPNLVSFNMGTEDSGSGASGGGMSSLRRGSGMKSSARDDKSSYAKPSSRKETID